MFLPGHELWCFFESVTADEQPLEEEATVLEADVQAAFTSLAVRFDEIVLPVLRFLRPYVCTGTMSLGLGIAKLSWPASADAAGAPPATAAAACSSCWHCSSWCSWRCCGGGPRPLLLLRRSSSQNGRSRCRRSPPVATFLGAGFRNDRLFLILQAADDRYAAGSRAAAAAAPARCSSSISAATRCRVRYRCAAVSCPRTLCTRLSGLALGRRGDDDDDAAASACIAIASCSSWLLPVLSLLHACRFSDGYLLLLPRLATRPLPTPPLQLSSSSSSAQPAAVPPPLRRSLLRERRHHFIRHSCQLASYEFMSSSSSSTADNGGCSRTTTSSSVLLTSLLLTSFFLPLSSLSSSPSSSSSCSAAAQTERSTGVAFPGYLTKRILILRPLSSSLSRFDRYIYIYTAHDTRFGRNKNNFVFRLPTQINKGKCGHECKFVTFVSAVSSSLYRTRAQERQRGTRPSI